MNNRLDMMRNWGKRNLKIILPAFVAVVLIIIMAFVFVNYSNERNSEETTEGAESQATTVAETVTQEDKQESHINMARSRITGAWVPAATADNVPVAVMYSNVEEAMPQSSISSADIIYEAIVEGNITRLCAVFENGTALNKIGPVRSCRSYYLFFAKEFEALYVHFGYSEYAEEYLQMSKMHALDGMVYCNFFRSEDRVAPHNAYTSWSGIMESAIYKGYSLQYPQGYVAPFSFNQDDKYDVQIAGGAACTTFYPGFTFNNPWFSYNEEDGLYYRYQFDKMQMDAENKQQLKCKNIIVKYVEGGYWPNGTPDYMDYGTGKGMYITNGKAIEVTWVKKDKYGSTKYYYEDGSEVLLNQGKTWICQVPAGQKSQVKVLG